jgi:hypothetical protein
MTGVCPCIVDSPHQRLYVDLDKDNVTVTLDDRTGRFNWRPRGVEPVEAFDAR